MKTQLQLTIFIIHFGLVFVHPHNRNGYQLWKNALQTGVLESQNIFNNMRDELQRAQNTNIQRKKSFAEKWLKKREINSPASPSTSPPLEEAYMNCLIEAQHQINEQKFHIQSINQSFQILTKLGMKMPEFTRQFNVLEDVHNFTTLLIGQKMRGEEAYEDKYDPLYKAAFLKFSQSWDDLIKELDKQTPIYNTENRLKKMKEEMRTASNASHHTYYLLTELQTGMSSTPKIQKWKGSNTTTTESISIRIDDTSSDESEIDHTEEQQLWVE